MQKNIAQFAFTLFALVTLPISSTSFAQRTPAAPIKIGQSVALTGPSQATGIAFRDGALLYFDYINKQGGINGREIQLEVLDDEGEPAKAAENAKKLIASNVTALFGFVGTTAAETVAPIALAQKTAFVAPSTGSPLLRATTNRYVFHIRASYADEVEHAIDQVAKQGLSKFGVLYQDDSFGKAVLGHVTESLAKRKIAVDLSVAVPLNAVSVTAQSKQMAAKDLHAIIIAVPYSAAGPFIKDMRAANRAASMINISSVGTQELRDTLRDQGRGVQMVNVVPSPWDPAVPVIREYQQRMNDIGRTDRFYSFASVEGFIAARVLVSGLRKAGKNIDRESLVAGLEAVNENYGGYPVTFGPNVRNGSKFVEMVMIHRDGRFLK
jgi:branched-chain amino acid transport system substrate-binding protein